MDIENFKEELTIGEGHTKVPDLPGAEKIHEWLDTYPVPKGTRRETFKLNIGSTRALLRQIAVLGAKHQPDPPVKKDMSQKEDADND